MKPKEKAQELKYKMENFTIYPKRCALIAVDEIIDVLWNTLLFETDRDYEIKEYWQEVKQEIENL